MEQNGMGETMSDEAVSNVATPEEHNLSFSVLAINDANLRALRAVREFALKKENWNDVQALIDGKDEAPGDRRPEYVARLSCGHTVVYSVDFLGDEMFHHISVSYLGGTPMQLAVAMLADMLSIPREERDFMLVNGIGHCTAPFFEQSADSQDDYTVVSEKGCEIEVRKFSGTAVPSTTEGLMEYAAPVAAKTPESAA